MLAPLDTADKAGSSAAGEVIWMRAIVRDSRPIFDVRLAPDGDFVNQRYDLVSGEPIE